MKPLTLAILSALSAGAHAAETAPSDTPAPAAAPLATTPEYLKPTTLDTLKVVGQRLFPYQEGMVLNERYIDEQAKGNGDIGTLLRINPNVQFDDTAMTSRNMGEIRPADISINGGLYYQNAFQLDGANFTNDLDPASNNPNHFADPPSHTQGLAVDASLIGSLIVYDSNVPASFGGFNGGVIVAESRKADDEFGGKVTYRMTRSAWNKAYVRDDYQQTFEDSATAANQPQYDKYQLGLMLEGRTQSGIGLIGNISRTRSVIPLRGQTGGVPSEHDDAIKDQERENTSISLRADWHNGGGLALEGNFTYAPTRERYFIQNAKDSWFDLEQGGPLISLRATLDRGAWTLKNTLSYSDLDDSRVSDGDYWFSWRWSEDKNWGTSTTGLSTEGNWGNVEQTNRSVGYKLEVDRDPFAFGRMEHRLQFGVEASDRKATYQRLRDFTSYITPAATTTCVDATGATDSVACSLSPVPFYSGRGQYLTRKTTYLAGYFEAKSTDWAAFLHDDIRMGNWSFRPGIRVDGSNMVADTTVAPRFAMSWDILGDRKSLLTAGANRYYGRNLFAYKLRDGRDGLTLVQTRTGTGANRLIWGTPVQTLNATRYAEIDTPYSDELSLGFNQVLGNYDVNAKYVNRQYEDEVMRVYLPSDDTTGNYAARVYEYQNVGRARSDTYTLSIGTRSPWSWAGSTTMAQFALDRTDTRRSYTGAYQDYSTTFDSQAYNALVRYAGDTMRRYELPADSYNRPWTVRLATQTRLPAWGLLWSNFLRYRAAYQKPTKVSEEAYGDGWIDVYEDVSYSKSFVLDTMLEYSLDLSGGQDAYARVEVHNVFNRENRIDGEDYDPGRTFWLELGYRF
jgi:hypothetical protein